LWATVGDEADQAGARAVRQAEFGLRNLHAARDDVDDAAETARHHAVYGKPHHLNRRQHHRVQRSDPIVPRPVAEIARQRTVRVVEEDIRGRTSGNCGRTSFAGGDVAGDGCHIDASRFGDFRARLLEYVARARDDGQFDAFSGEREGASLPETSARATQKGLSAADSEVH
jgi:hypothetical protein